MGDKFYRLKELALDFKALVLKFAQKAKTETVNFAEKYKLDEKAKKLATKFAKESVETAETLKTKGLTKKQTIVISSLLVACLIIVLIPTKQTNSPLEILSKIETAMSTGNASTVVQLVDAQAISADMANAIIGQISSKKLTQDLLGYMQQDLENKINDDFYNIIAQQGDFYQNVDDDNAILSKMLNFLANKTAKVIGTEVIEQNEETAVIQLMVFRPDLEQEIAINLQLQSQEKNWVLVKINNLSELIKTIEKLEEQRIEKLNAQIRENFNSYVVLRDFQKSNLNIKDNSFLMRISLENISKEDIKELQGKLRLMYKNQLIGSVNIKVEDSINANNFYEKAWSIKLTDFESLKNLARIKSEDIIALLDIEKIVFEKGKVLELVK